MRQPARPGDAIVHAETLRQPLPASLRSPLPENPDFTGQILRQLGQGLQQKRQTFDGAKFARPEDAQRAIRTVPLAGLLRDRGDSIARSQERRQSVDAGEVFLCERVGDEHRPGDGTAADARTESKLDAVHDGPRDLDRGPGDSRDAEEPPGELVRAAPRSPHVRDAELPQIARLAEGAEVDEVGEIERFFRMEFGREGINSPMPKVQATVVEARKAHQELDERGLRDELETQTGDGSVFVEVAANLVAHRAILADHSRIAESGGLQRAIPPDAAFGTASRTASVGKQQQSRAAGLFEVVDRSSIRVQWAPLRITMAGTVCRINLKSAPSD